MSNHLKGLLITLAGIAALSPDSLLVRMIDTDPWTLLFWRGVLNSLGIALFSVGFHRRNAAVAFRGVGGAGIGMAAVFSASTVFFIIALHNTSVANTLILAGTAPVFAALLSGIFLGEQVAFRTWVTIIVVIGAVALIVSGSFAQGTIPGDMSALACAVALAATFVITRHAKDRDMTPAMALSGLLTAGIMLPLAVPLNIDSRSAVLLLTLGVLTATAFALLIVGPRYIPALEVSMLMPLETVLGTFLVWLVIGEIPGVHAMIGGGIVILALALHSALALRAQSPPP